MSRKRKLGDAARDGRLTAQQITRMVQMSQDLHTLSFALDEENARLKERLALLEAVPRVGCEGCNWTGYVDLVDEETGKVLVVWHECAERAAGKLAGFPEP